MKNNRDKTKPRCTTVIHEANILFCYFLGFRTLY